MGYFRFRRSISIAPGIRVNFGKRGASISAGVRGAHMTFGGRGGMRTTIGIPGTGASYTHIAQTQKSADDAELEAALANIPTVPPIAALCLVVISFVIVGMAILHQVSLNSFKATMPVALIICVAAAALASRQFYVVSRLRELKKIIERSEPNPQPKISKTKLDTLVKAKRTAEHLIDEEQKAADILGKFKFYYLKDGETIGPVTLWRIHEMIEMDQVTPDVQLMMEGSDYWRSYARLELAIFPRSNNAEVSKLSRAADLECFYWNGEKAVGPLTLLAIFHYIRSGKLTPDVQICAAGSSEWKPACDV